MKKRSSLSRRSFIATTVKAGVAAAVFPAIVPASDPIPDASGVKPLDASDPAIIRSVIGPNEIHLYVSDDQHGNWLDCIASRKAPITNAEIAHRACSACLIHHIAMKLKRKVYWDPAAEKFKNDDEANRMLSRPQRAPYLVV